MRTLGAGAHQSISSLSLCGNADCHVLTAVVGMIFDGNGGAFPHLAIHLSVLIHHEIHGVLAFSSHFQAERVSAISDAADFAGNGLGGSLFLLGGRLLSAGRKNGNRSAHGQQARNRNPCEKFANHGPHLLVCGRVAGDKARCLPFSHRHAGTTWRGPERGELSTLLPGTRALPDVAPGQLGEIFSWEAALFLRRLRYEEICRAWTPMRHNRNVRLWFVPELHTGLHVRS